MDFFPHTHPVHQSSHFEPVQQAQSLHGGRRRWTLGKTDPRRRLEGASGGAAYCKYPVLNVTISASPCSDGWPDLLGYSDRSVLHRLQVTLCLEAEATHSIISGILVVSQDVCTLGRGLLVSLVVLGLNLKWNYTIWSKPTLLESQPPNSSM